MTAYLVSDPALNQVQVHKMAQPEPPYFFEGAEKLLEIWFARPMNASGKCSLRNIPYDELVQMLEVCRCHILHHTTNGVIDSYVLSESSMFITDDRVILKTCGTTRLLMAIECVRDLAKKYAGMDTIANVFYSRKNFVRPELQPALHRSFDSEVAFLDEFFDDGSAYCMGSLKEDRWYLYCSDGENTSRGRADHTLEVLMTDIPSEVLQVYSKAECKDGKECTMRSGINKILPIGTEVHSELFDPVGYSMNGLIPDSDEYVTIHVTPEKEFCYVSFETNQRRGCLHKQTMKVLDCFKPNKFLLTLFANEESSNGKDSQWKIWNQEIPGYKRTNLQFLRLQHDSLVYAQFTRRNTTTKRRRMIDDDEDSEDSNGCD
uniref:S-adenosylmethionine decarboxylase proenzyme n=1 Tax=Acrobeloides nanus TaxID=290746 RepID=A0A914DKP3_9BILA